MKTSFKNNWSSLTLLFLLFILLKQFFYIEKYESPHPVPYDMGAYYGYLPLSIIHHDILNKKKAIKDEKLFGTKKLQNGNVIKMTMGVSIMQSPFFLAAHLLSSFRGKETTGYTRTYMFFIYFSGLFYVFFGLFFLRKILLNYFPDLIVSFSLLIILCGTNLLYYAIDEAPMSHSYNFFLFSLFLFLTIFWHKTPKLYLAIILGICAGLIVLIRPVNIILLLTFPFFGISQKGSLKEKIQLYKTYFWHLFVMIFFGFLAIFPQLLYWKTISGDWLYYSYGEEKLWLTNSHFIDALFSYRKGWLVYTPVMIFSVFGMFLLKKITDWKYIIFGLFFMYVYVVFSWWCWWYGGSFSSRPMIDMYPLLAISFAAFAAWIFKFKIWVKIPFLAIVSFLVYLNIFQTNQYRVPENRPYTLLHWDSMSKDLYWDIFLKKEKTEKYDQLKSEPNYDKALNGGE